MPGDPTIHGMYSLCTDSTTQKGPSDEWDHGLPRQSTPNGLRCLLEYSGMYGVWRQSGACRLSPSSVFLLGPQESGFVMTDWTTSASWPKDQGV